jgi:hypothetical protein
VAGGGAGVDAAAGETLVEVVVDVDVLDDVDVTGRGTVVAGSVGRGFAGSRGASVVVVVGRVVVVVVRRVVGGAGAVVVGATVGTGVMPPDETTVNVASSERTPSPVSHMAVTVWGPSAAASGTVTLVLRASGGTVSSVPPVEWPNSVWGVSHTTNQSLKQFE